MFAKLVTKMPQGSPSPKGWGQEERGWGFSGPRGPPWTGDRDGKAREWATRGAELAVTGGEQGPSPRTVPRTQVLTFPGRGPMSPRDGATKEDVFTGACGIGSSWTV